MKTDITDKQVRMYLDMVGTNTRSVWVMARKILETEERLADILESLPSRVIRSLPDIRLSGQPAMERTKPWERDDGSAT